MWVLTRGWRWWCNLASVLAFVVPSALGTAGIEFPTQGDLVQCAVFYWFCCLVVAFLSDGSGSSGGDGHAVDSLERGGPGPGFYGVVVVSFAVPVAGC